MAVGPHKSSQISSMATIDDLLIAADYDNSIEDMFGAADPLTAAATTEDDFMNLFSDDLFDLNVSTPIY
jgi:hypothetical protein